MTLGRRLTGLLPRVTQTIKLPPVQRSRTLPEPTIDVNEDAMNDVKDFLERFSQMSEEVQLEIEAGIEERRKRRKRQSDSATPKTNRKRPKRARKAKAGTNSPAITRLDDPAAIVYHDALKNNVVIVEAEGQNGAALMLSPELCDTVLQAIDGHRITYDRLGQRTANLNAGQKRVNSVEEVRLRLEQKYDQLMETSLLSPKESSVERMMKLKIRQEEIMEHQDGLIAQEQSEVQEMRKVYETQLDLDILLCNNLEQAFVAAGFRGRHCPIDYDAEAPSFDVDMMEDLDASVPTTPASPDDLYAPGPSPRLEGTAPSPHSGTNTPQPRDLSDEQKQNANTATKHTKRFNDKPHSPERTPSEVVDDFPNQNLENRESRSVSDQVQDVVDGVPGSAHMQSPRDTTSATGERHVYDETEVRILPDGIYLVDFGGIVEWIRKEAGNILSSDGPPAKGSVRGDSSPRIKQNALQQSLVVHNEAELPSLPDGVYLVDLGGEQDWIEKEGHSILAHDGPPDHQATVESGFSTEEPATAQEDRQVYSESDLPNLPDGIYLVDFGGETEWIRKSNGAILICEGPDSSNPPRAPPRRYSAMEDLVADDARWVDGIGMIKVPPLDEWAPLMGDQDVLRADVFKHTEQIKTCEMRIECLQREVAEPQIIVDEADTGEIKQEEIDEAVARVNELTAEISQKQRKVKLSEVRREIAKYRARWIGCVVDNNGAYLDPDGDYMEVENLKPSDSGARSLRVENWAQGIVSGGEDETTAPEIDEWDAGGEIAPWDVPYADCHPDYEESRFSYKQDCLDHFEKHEQLGVEAGA